MSVPESKRGEGKFTVIAKSEELARYTIQITANENIFIQKYQNAVTNGLIDAAKNQYLKVRAANNVMVRNGHPEDARRRIRFQVEAIEDCNSLLYMVDLAYRVFHLRSSRVSYWGQMIVDTRNAIKRWMDKDILRYL